MKSKTYKPSHGGYCKPSLSECMGEFMKSVSEVVGNIKSLRVAAREGEVRGGKGSQLTENYPLLPASGKYKDPQSGILCPRCKIYTLKDFNSLCHHCESLSRNHAH